ncbi:MAG: NYN domain-containing protein, partial [Planctomycetota bacterium]
MTSHPTDPTWWLIVDGYNVIAPVAPPQNRQDPRWLDIQRRRLLDQLADHLPSEVCRRTCVVFDAKNPPPGVDDRMVHRDIHVRFARDFDEADDMIQWLVAKHSVPKKLMLVSSDHRVAAAGNRRGVQSCDSDVWLDQLTEGKLKLAVDVSHLDDSHVDDLRAAKDGPALQDMPAL